MRKVFLSALVIGAFVFSTLPVGARSRRCPVKMPETLLSLYKKSDAIFIARFDRKEDVSIASEGDGYSVVNVKSHFDVSSALKGETQKLFVLEDEEYRYKTEPQDENAPAEPAVFIEDFEAEGGGALAAGDPVLLFLKKGEDIETLALADYRDAVKRLTPEQMPVYINRIKELNSIFAGPKADNEEIVAWLIRCAEDPMTRWEGTFELQQSYERLEWRKRGKDNNENQSANPETEGMPVEHLDEVADTSIFAEILTDDQKQTLSNILINREFRSGSVDEKKDPSVWGDRELIELMKYWGDERVAAALIEQLKSGSFEPYDSAQMMTTIAATTSNKAAAAIARQYEETSYMDDDAVVESEETESSDEVEEPVENNKLETADAQQSTEITEPANSPETVENEQAADKPKKQTYKELRHQLLSDFVAIVEKTLQGEKTKIAQ